MNAYKLRTLLNSIFLLGALISIVVYFAVEDKSVFLYVCGATIFVKVVEFIVRFTYK